MARKSPPNPKKDAIPRCNNPVKPTMTLRPRAAIQIINTEVICPPSPPANAEPNNGAKANTMNTGISQFLLDHFKKQAKDPVYIFNVDLLLFLISHKFPGDEKQGKQ
jgi:hypothetical protein